ncbi:MAG: PAS domain-containing sensor histidine kinase, partial [Comamonas sp.]
MQSSPNAPEKQAQIRDDTIAAPVRWWRSWWRSLSPTRQDRFAALAPLAAVLMFMAAITASFWYLRTEEVEREQDALRRDVEYAQQRVRLRLLERQEQLMRMARDMGTRDLKKADFSARAEALISQYPELQSVTLVDDKRKVLESQSAPTVSTDQQHVLGETLGSGETGAAIQQAREMLQPIYVQQPASKGEMAPLLQLHVPILSNNRYVGELLGEFSVDSLLRYGTPTEIMARYAVTMLDSQGQV